MPIKKHIVSAESYTKPGNVEPDYVFVRIPKSICTALGIGSGTPLKIYSDKNNYSFTVEVPMSYENLTLLEQLREKNLNLCEQNRLLQEQLEKQREEFENKKKEYEQRLDTVRKLSAL